MRQLKITKSITNRTDSMDKYFNEISSFSILSAEEEVELAERRNAGDKEALQKLITHNLRFAVSVAKQYQNQGLTLADLVNEANIGLIKAAERFDQTRGFKFISYAVWWIRQHIIQAIAEQARIVRIPINQEGKLLKINRVKNALGQELEREPTIEELHEVLDELGLHEIERLSEIASRPVRADAPISDDDGTPLSDLLFTTEAQDPHWQDDLSFIVKKYLDLLTEREAIILKRFYGIGSKEYTLDEIGEYLGLTRERVRQIKEKAIRRIRSRSRGKHIHDGIL